MTGWGAKIWLQRRGISWDREGELKKDRKFKIWGIPPLPPLPTYAHRAKKKVSCKHDPRLLGCLARKDA